MKRIGIQATHHSKHTLCIEAAGQGCVRCPPHSVLRGRESVGDDTLINTLMTLVSFLLKLTGGENQKDPVGARSGAQTTTEN